MHISYMAFVFRVLFQFKIVIIKSGNNKDLFTSPILKTNKYTLERIIVDS